MPELTDRTIIIVIVACGVVGASVILTVICALCCCRRKSQEKTSVGDSVGANHQRQYPANQTEGEAPRSVRGQSVQDRAVELGALEQPPAHQHNVSASRGEFHALPGLPSPKPSDAFDAPPSRLVDNAGAPSYVSSSPPRIVGHPLAINEASLGDAPRSDSVVVNSVGSAMDV